MENWRVKNVFFLLIKNALRHSSVNRFSDLSYSLKVIEQKNNFWYTVIPTCYVLESLLNHIVRVHFILLLSQWKRMNPLSLKFLSLILKTRSARFNTSTVPGLIYSLEQAIKYALLLCAFSLNPLKRYGRSFNVCCWMKAGSLTELPIVWFHLHNILEQVKLRKEWKDQWLLRIQRETRKDEQMEHREY